MEETAGLRQQQVTAVTQELLPSPFPSDLCLAQREMIGELTVFGLFPYLSSSSLEGGLSLPMEE